MSSCTFHFGTRAARFSVHVPPIFRSLGVDLLCKKYKQMTCTEPNAALAAVASRVSSKFPAVMRNVPPAAVGVVSCQGFPLFSGRCVLRCSPRAFCATMVRFAALSPGRCYSGGIGSVVFALCVRGPCDMMRVACRLWSLTLSFGATVCLRAVTFVYLGYTPRAVGHPMVQCSGCAPPACQLRLPLTAESTH